MGSEYNFGINPFRDFLIKVMEYGADISKSRNKKEIDISFRYILENVLKNEKEAVHLDFEITNKDGFYKIIAKNPPTAFWLSGILVENVDDMMDKNVFIIAGRKYKYNKKTGDLTFTLKK